MSTGQDSKAPHQSTPQKKFKQTWHAISTNESLAILESNPETGLSSEQVAQRQAQYGVNELVETTKRSTWRILWEQFQGPMVALLLVAAVVSLFLHEQTDSVVILAIVLINAALGFFQDFRAEKALAALKKMAVPIVRVRRNGSLSEISSRELIPGDLVLLEAGNQVPADCRLLESFGLKVEEAALTGESESIAKQTKSIDRENLPLGDRKNIVFMGTIVTHGHGQAIVTETGMQTELGQIAQSLQAVEEEPTPLQVRLAQLGKSLAIVALAIVAIVTVIGLLRGEELKLMLLTALSLAVAVVPEGLPAVATVTLALGARRMFKRQALIRKLPAVETLGSVTVICSDKTGTLTENKMTVTELEVAGQRLNLTDAIKHPSALAENPALNLLMIGASLCNDAEIESNDSSSRLHAIGDPTETALVLAAAKTGIVKSEMYKYLPRQAEIAFDSDRKRMTTAHTFSSTGAIPDELQSVREFLTQSNSTCLSFTKGAVDCVLDRCSMSWNKEGPDPIDEETRQRLIEMNEEFAAGGMRVLGVALRSFPGISALQQLTGDDQESELIFIGMLAMFDPPRPEVAEAVERCRSAGIRPIMITGDHPLTALSIAEQLQMSSENQQVISGAEIEEMDDTQLAEAVEQCSVYARVAPRHKLRLVQTLQAQGNVVAMSGDGVNDAPALKQAHIGVAMGITGTDVAKEASQMVLLDDNFATVVNAVEEGRIVYDNIRKFVKYTMTSNAGEVCVMLLGPLLGMPMPLLPLQILWVNLVTDGLPGLALATEQAERDIMSRKPLSPHEHIFGRQMSWDIAWIGLLMGIVSLAFGYWYWALEEANQSHWRTIIFTVLTCAQMGNALAIRSDRDSLFRIGLHTNPFLMAAVALTFGLQLLVIYFPPMQSIFQTTALSWLELAICFALSTVVFWAVEIQKLLK